MSYLKVILSIGIFMIFLYLLENYLTSSLLEEKERRSSPYQGGENIESDQRPYRPESYQLTIYFMILHIIGFLGATLYVLHASGVNPLNWATLTFGGMMLYIVYVIRTTEGVTL